MKCQQCGADVAPTDTFCGACGSPVAAPGGATPPPPPGGQFTTPPGEFTTPPGQYQMPPAPPPPVGSYGPARFADPATGAPLAEWWQRAVAAIIDYFVVAIPSLILYFIFAAAFSTTTINLTTGRATKGIAIGGLVIVIVLVIALQIGYYVYCNGGEKGQTVGKMAMGIATRDESGNAPLGYGRAMGRWATVFALTILCYLPVIVDYLSPLWDPRRQAWHDKAAHSVVIAAK
jgi:uncharacterized RDD family membrane protein YckC